MSLPKQLLKSFDDLKKSPLVAGIITKETVQLFVDTLNESIPRDFKTSAAIIYRYNRSLYIANKDRFLTNIKGFYPYEALILWTDYEHILNYFGLTGKIFLGWSKEQNQYRAFVHSGEPSQSIQILRRNQKLSDIKEAGEIECYNDIREDMDRVYENMYDRIAKIKAQEASHL